MAKKAKKLNAKKLEKKAPLSSWGTSGTGKGGG